MLPSDVPRRRIFLTLLLPSLLLVYGWTFVLHSRSVFMYDWQWHYNFCYVCTRVSDQTVLMVYAVVNLIWYDLLFFYFKRQWKRAQATYMPVKSSTVMHVKQ